MSINWDIVQQLLFMGGAVCFFVGTLIGFVRTVMGLYLPQ